MSIAGKAITGRNPDVDDKPEACSRLRPGVRVRSADLVPRVLLLGPALKLILQGVDAEADERDGYCEACGEQYAHIDLQSRSIS